MRSLEESTGPKGNGGLRMRNLDEVKCLHCGHIGLTSTNHCKQCYGDHKVVIE